MFENRYDVPAPVFVKPPGAVRGKPVPAVILVPKIKFPEALIAAEPPIVAVPIMTVLIEVIDKLLEPAIANASIILTLPPKNVMGPARLTALFIEIFPVLLAAPIVSPLPVALDVMD